MTPRRITAHNAVTAGIIPYRVLKAKVEEVEADKGPLDWSRIVPVMITGGVPWDNHSVTWFNAGQGAAMNHVPTSEVLDWLNTTQIAHELVDLREKMSDYYHIVFVDAVDAQLFRMAFKAQQ